MAIVTPEDDWIHPIGEEPGWREAFYFDFFDPRARLTGFGYSGVHPNQELGDAIFALWRDDVLLARFTRWDFNIPRDIGEERLDFGPVRFAPVRPLEAWRMGFDDGWCRLDLDFEAIHSPYSWAQSDATLAASGSHHYEQQGRYRGSVRIGTERAHIDAVGVRDHAWGWGARAGLRRWLWSSAQLGGGLAFNTFHVALADGRELLYGYLHRGGENRPLARSRVKVRYAARGPAPAALELALEDRAGGRVAATARVVNAFNVSFQERNKQGYHFFCATEYEHEGRRGYGHSNLYWRAAPLRPEQWQAG